MLHCGEVKSALIFVYPLHLVDLGNAALILVRIPARILPRIRKKKCDFLATFQRTMIKSAFMFEFLQNSGDSANNKCFLSNSGQNFAQNSKKKIRFIFQHFSVEPTYIFDYPRNMGNPGNNRFF